MKKIKDKVCTNHLPSFLSVGAGFFLFFFGDGWTEAFAQQLPFSSQYYTDQFVFNPAFTGTTDNVSAYLTHRSQWTGITGAPQTSYFTLDGPAPTKNVGLGVKVYSDNTDMISRVGAFANYSYRLKINDDNNLYLGLAMGALDTKIDFSKAVFKDKDDPFLFQTLQNKTVFSADFGMAYMWKRLTVGFAIPQILGNKVKYALLIDDNNSYYNLSRHYQGTIKYVFDVIKEKGITAYPLIMVRTVSGAPIQYDINGVIDWKKIGWAGLTYHSNDALAISAGVRYHNFSLGYAYDIGISKISSYTGSSSEFLLGYIFGESKKAYVKSPEAIAADSLKDLVKARTDSTVMALLAQLKAEADSNRVEIDRLKAQLAALKAAGANPSPADQAQMDQLKARIATIEATKTVDNLIHSLSSTESEAIPANINTKPVASSGGIVRTSESDDFTDERGKPASKGFYVIVGTFGNKENADRFKAANIIKGHANTKIIQNNFTKVYNIYVMKTNNRADADTERARYKVDYPDVWILILE